MKDKEFEKELRLFNKNPWTEESDRRLISFLYENKWSINVAGHKFTGKPSYICTVPVNCKEPVMSIKEWDGLVQIEITAPLSQFTRVQAEK